MRARTMTGAVSGTLASTCAASCPKFRTACAPSARSPSTPDSPSTKWWTRYSPTRWLAPTRACSGVALDGDHDDLGSVVRRGRATPVAVDVCDLKARRQQRAAHGAFVAKGQDVATAGLFGAGEVAGVRFVGDARQFNLDGFVPELHRPGPRC